MRKSLLTTSFFFFFLILAFAATAQTGLIRGTVKDVTGLPLAGASVILEGTRRGTTTDANGYYEIRVEPGNYTLIISYVGVQTQTKQVTVSANAVSENNFDMQSSGELGRVTVIGSRSAVIRTNTQTAVPVDVISNRELNLTGQVEPSQMIHFVAPSFNSSRQAIADGTDHIDPATLRGLWPDQVLVLVNGRRRYNTALLNVNGTVGRGSVGTDLNSIPPAAIERVEVLRDGASSQYGSDAIAGVINIVTKKNNRGLTASSHWGKQYAGDGEVRQFGLNWGMKVGKEGYFNISGDLRYRDATNRSGKYTGTVYTNNVAMDEQLIEQNGGFDRFNNMHIGNSELENKGVLANLGFPMGKNLSFFVTAGLNHREGEAAGFYRYPKQSPNQVILALHPKGFLPEIHSEIKDKYAIAGVEGQFGQGWRWDLSQTSGGNSFRFDVKNSNNATQFALGAAAPTEFYAGTLKFVQHTSNFNISKDFGSQIGVETFNIAGGLEYRRENYKIEPGEEASYADYDNTAGSTKVPGAQVFPGFQPANQVDESRDVLGGYLDLESDITDKFLVNVAGRYEHYSDYGSSVAGKLALRYELLEALAIRGAVSNGFRAPSMHQRFFSAISTVFISTGSGLQPFQQGTFRNNSVVAQAFGVPGLEAEKSMNYSVGLTSRLANNKVNITVDAYLIDIKDRIVISSSFRRFSAPEAPAVDAILDQYPALDDVSSVVFFNNAIDTRTKGLDIVTSFSDKVGRGQFTLTIAGNLNETKVEGEPRVSTITDPTLQARLFGRDDKARIEEAQPKDKFSVNLNYRIEKFGINLRATRFGRVWSRDPSNPALDEDFSAKIVTDASFSYRLGNFANIIIGANNLMDTYPDKLAHVGNTGDGRFVYSRAAIQWGFNGGYYYASLSIDLHNLGLGRKPINGNGGQ